MTSEGNRPTLAEEKRLWAAGYRWIAGVDEAGRGALAGPVVAGAVMLPPGVSGQGIWAEVRDSKLLSPEKRSALAVRIREQAAAWAVGQATAQEIDRFGIAPATALAMRRAIEELVPAPRYLLLDWVRLPTVNIPQQSVTKGDRRIVSIAAASILAKTHRDALLVDLHGRYPQYAFHQHKGYATAAHRVAIAQHGPCAAHRHSFAPIARRQSLFDGV